MNEETKGRDVELEEASDAVEPRAGGESRVETAEFCARFRRAFSKFLRDNFLVSEGTLLYGLSAVSILLGLAMLIGPILGASFDPWKTIPCIGALNGYELALLGVLLLILAWGNAVSDGVTLVVLIGVFLGASGIANTAVANDSPDASAILGVTCLVLAGIKLTALIVRVGVPLRGWLLAALGLLLACNFLAAPIMAQKLAIGRNVEGPLLQTWYLEAAALTGAWFLLWIAAIRTPSRYGPNGEAASGERQWQVIAWAFTLVLLAGVTLHLPALSYVYVLDMSEALIACLPFILLGALLMIELLRCFGTRKYSVETIIALLPSVLLIVWGLSPDGDVSRPNQLRWLWEPGFLFLFMAAATAWRSTRHYWPRFLHAPAVYLALAFLVARSRFGMGLDDPFLIVLLWSIVIFVTVAQREPAYLVGSAILFCIVGLMYGLEARSGRPMYHGPVFAQIGGTLILCVCTLALTKGTRWTRFVGVLMLLLGIYLLLGPYTPVRRDVLYTRILVLVLSLDIALAVLLLVRMRDYTNGIILLGGVTLSLSWKMLVSLSSLGMGWLLVLASFMLLGLGAYLTLTGAPPLEAQRTRTSGAPLNNARNNTCVRETPS